MSYHSSLVQAADCSERICSDGVQLATSSGTTIASESSRTESQTESCQSPRSSLTCVSSSSPVQPSSIAELRTWLRQAFPASHLALPESNSLVPTNGTCGQPRETPFALFDQRTCSWRTSQDSLLADTRGQSSVNWPKWASWDGTAAYPLHPRVLITCENDGGFVPTPRHCDGKKGSGARKDGGGSYGLGHWVASQLGLAQSTTTKFDPGLSEWLMGWPIGWTALEPLEMDKYHEWLQLHGSYSALS
jgi:hypothetical protein